MKKILSLLSVVALAHSVMGQSPWDNGKLTVSENGRYLQHTNGKPFFWLGDTCWLLVQKLDRDQINAYFADRKAKGFNVVQTVVFQLINDKNVYGDSAILDGDFTKLNMTPGHNPANPAEYDYWDHVEFAIDSAAAHGIYLAIAPTWAHTVRRAPVTKEQAEPYVTVIAERFKKKPNVVWLNGGSARGNENADVWEVIGTTIKKIAPNHLMMFHPFGRTQSSTWFQNTAWLDFNSFTSGHRRYDQDIEGKKFGEDNWRYVLEDLAKSPRKPTLDTEPSYENTPQGLHDATQPYWGAADARRYAYWAVFAGAAGHTYGENSVRQVYLPSDAQSASGAKGYFTERLQAEGAGQMQHLKHLILSRPYFSRVNDQSLVAGDEGEKYDRVLVTRGDGFVMAYVHTGRTFKLNLGGIKATELKAWWFNPRTGKADPAGQHRNSSAVTFDPPGEAAPGNDWVLVLDDVTRNFKPPGAH